MAGSDQVIGRWWPLLAIAAAGWSLAGWFVDRLVSDPWHLLPLGAALYLLFSRRSAVRYDPPPVTATLVMFAFAFAIPFLPPLLGATSLALVATLVASPRFFQRRLHAGFGGLLLLSLPTLPALQLIIGYPLRIASGAIAAVLLRLGGMPAERVGTILQVDSELYSIDAPCSGISMWWTALLIVAWIAARSDASAIRAFLGASVATAIVVGGNALRSAALVQLEVSRLPVPDWFHEAVGTAAFVLCAGAIILLLGRAKEVRACAVR
jgi:exosortase/archaeosortase family protein